jgi:hypothetical protein
MSETELELDVMGVMICEKDGWTQAVLIDSMGAETVCDLDPDTGLWQARMMLHPGDEDHHAVMGLVDVGAVVDAMLGREVSR